MTYYYNGTSGSDVFTYKGLYNYSAGYYYYQSDALHAIGGDGDDLIGCGYNYNDTLDGGNGNDYLDAEYSSGNNLLYGGNGNDYLDAEYSSGNNLLYGGNGNDTIHGGSGGDYVDAGAGNDTIYNFDNLYDSTLFGGDGNDYIYAGYGNDTINGGAGNDYLDGGNNGKDTLNGGSGNDTINGNTGNDVLTGGAGKDFLTGGTETDKFTYTALSDSLLASYDVITDYTSGEKIDRFGGSAVTLTTSVGKIASLTAANISALLKTSVFTGSSSKAFTVTGISGTFLAFNDTTAGYNSANDSILLLQNYTLGSVSIV